MQFKVLTVPTTSTVLKGVRSNVLPSMLIDETTDWLLGIYPDGTLVAAFICIFFVIVALVLGKPFVGRRLLGFVCELGASFLPTTLNLNLLPLLVGLARTSFAMLAPAGRAGVVIHDDLKPLGRARHHEKQMAGWRGWGFYGWQLTNYLKRKDQAKLNSVPMN